MERYLDSTGVIGYPCFVFVTDKNNDNFYEIHIYKTLNNAVKFIKRNVTFRPSRDFSILPISYLEKLKIKLEITS